MSSIYKALTHCFNLNELRDLCFELNIQYEELPNLDGTRSAFAFALVEHSYKSGILQELIELCSSYRKNIDWFQFIDNSSQLSQNSLPHPRIQALFSQSLESLKDKRYEIAIRQLESLCAQAPDLPEAYCYLALANLKGRSFNLHLHQLVEFEENVKLAIDCLRMQQKDWLLPRLLLAILEIDYYNNHGLQSRPFLTNEILNELETYHWKADDLEIIRNQTISSKAKEELGLKEILRG